MLTFDRLSAGELLGSTVLTFDAAWLEHWERLFPGSVSAAGNHLPSGLAVALSMRGYIELLGDRPKGNVHAGLQLVWGDPIPRSTDVVARLLCARKELKNERRWVWFDNELMSRHGALHLKASMTLLWAA